MVSQLAADHGATNRLTGGMVDRQEKVLSPTLLHQAIMDGSDCTLLMPSPLPVNAPHHRLWEAARPPSLVVPPFSPCVAAL